MSTVSPPKGCPQPMITDGLICTIEFNDVVGFENTAYQFLQSDFRSEQL